MTFVFQRPPFSRDVYDHLRTLLKHSSHDVDAAAAYGWADP